MALNPKQIYDLNNMNSAAQNARLGDIVSNGGMEPSPATTETLGVVKQAVAVADAAGVNVTKEEFNALLTALRNAGILAPNA